jgi:hypothetical protein
MDANQIKSIVIEAFREFGATDITENDVNLIPDRENGGFRRFCFVLVDPSIATEVVNNFENSDQSQAEYPLVVNIAKPREEHGDRRGNGGGFKKRDFSSRRDDSYSGGNSRRDW